MSLPPPLVSVQGLSISFQHQSRTVEAVKGIDFYVDAGECVGLVGESGSGKTLSALSLIKLLPKSAAISAKRLEVGGQDIVSLDDASLRHLRATSMGVIFQEPMTSLNPLHTVEQQIGEALGLAQTLSTSQKRQAVVELLHKVQIDEPERRLADYPHLLSGGQRQRVMIAIALANKPRLLIADEPTTALDVTIQAEILDLLKHLQHTESMALLLISHDLSIVRHMTTRTYIMERGLVVEEGQTQTIFHAPKANYTKELLASDVMSEPPQRASTGEAVLKADQLKVHFPIKRGIFRKTIGYVKAVDGIDVTIEAGETLGVIGESGSGKTSLLQALLALIPSEGLITFQGHDVKKLDKQALRQLRGSMPIVFQDPFGSLSPRMTVGEIIAEGLDIHQPNLSMTIRRDRVKAMMKEVDLDTAFIDRYPHEFSGGQRQRIAIARALVLEPKLIFLDEPTSALDKTVQKKVLELLLRLQDKFGLSYLFVSHDLRVVSALAHRVMVMRKGLVVEQNDTKTLFSKPSHPYTQQLIKASLTS